MTTKPVKARKFRIKRNTQTNDREPALASAGASEHGLDTVAQPNATRDAAQHRAPKVSASVPPVQAPSARVAAPRVPNPQQNTQREGGGSIPPSSPAPADSSARVTRPVKGDQAAQLESIRAENLTDRQLRMAVRIAQKQGIEAESELDAVRVLRSKGIDPFLPANAIGIIQQPDTETKAEKPKRKGKQTLGRIQLPQTVPDKNKNLPSAKNKLKNPEDDPVKRRIGEIAKIQKDIAARRRKKVLLLTVRLLFFTLLPTCFAGYYFAFIASPMFSTESSFLIIQNEGGASSSPFGGLLPTQFATNSDAIATQGYLQSKDAMLRLDRDLGFKAHFSDPKIDPIQRLEENATNEEAYKTYKKNIKIGYDPTEGMIRMEVIAPDPEVSAEFSRRLIEYAQERVNNLSLQKRNDTMRDAIEFNTKAIEKQRAAKETLIALQAENGIDPQAVIASLRAQITQYEALAIDKELELSALLDNQRPNKSKVEGVRADIGRIQSVILRLQKQMRDPVDGKMSLSQQSIALELAQVDLAEADSALRMSETAMEQARAEAGRQVRYLTIAVAPVASEEASYPRVFENTLLAFLVFAGIYLMISLTSSILREQIAS